MGHLITGNGCLGHAQLAATIQSRRRGVWTSSRSSGTKYRRGTWVPKTTCGDGGTDSSDTSEAPFSESVSASTETPGCKVARVMHATTAVVEDITVGKGGAEREAGSSSRPSTSQPTYTGSSVPEEAVLAGEQFVAGLGLVLTRWVEATAAAYDGKAQKVTHFHSVRKPTMSVKDYLKRIHKYFFCSDECYVLALVYIDRVSKSDPAMTVSELNIHRLLAVAVTLAAKFHDDVFYSNAYYSKVGGFTLRELNLLEAKLLKLLDWKTLVDSKEYQLYRDLVCKAVGPSKGKEPEPEP